MFHPLATISSCSVPFGFSPSAISNLDLSLRVPRSRLASYGAMIRLSVGVALRRDGRIRLFPDPLRYGRAPPPRCCVAATPRPRGAVSPLIGDIPLLFLA